ncbi:uncharacterized protein LOC122077099 [Macadamia integrifolia]|uniref:uncharacterized protein LOC122077099 n=1 Tax=Macadamia integrifolia TaxID=60698 RepID=UPI001C4F5183|nr:uncharacterized protein LOC122077099 [Macadamia integrifolia]
MIRLDFPRLDDTDLLGWIFKADRFFDYHNMVDPQQLQVSSFQVDGPVLQWFQWMHREGQFTTWSAFTRDLEIRFGPSEFEDHQGAIAKLTQSTTVADYQSWFETLANRTSNITSAFLVSCFISSVRPDICCEVLAFRPSLMAHVVGLARLQEAKLLDGRRSFSRLPPPARPLLLPASSSPLHFPIRRFTPMDMQNCREQGLCYNCNERFVSGHRCKTRQLFLLEYKEDATETELSTDYVEASDAQMLFNQDLSYHALTGHSSPSTLRFTDYVVGSPIQVLIDGGSTNNFIQSRVTTPLGLAIAANSQIEGLCSCWKWRTVS